MIFRKGDQVLSTNVSENITNHEIETNDSVDMNEINIQHENTILSNLSPFQPVIKISELGKNDMSGIEFSETIYNVYEETIQWRKNLFKTANGKSCDNVYP